MSAHADVMRERAGLVEQPFGTLKRRAGWDHLLVRGLDKVRGEWSLMALAYNFTRVLNILGLERFKEICAQRNTLPPKPIETVVAGLCRRVYRLLRDLIENQWDSNIAQHSIHLYRRFTPHNYGGASVRWCGKILSQSLRCTQATISTILRLRQATQSRQ